MRPFIAARGPSIATGAAMRLRLNRCLAAFTTVAILGVASAQVTITVTGALQGALDGDIRTWYSLTAQVGGSVLSETSLDEMGFAGTESYLLQVSWFAEQSLASEGKLKILGRSPRRSMSARARSISSTSGTSSRPILWSSTTPYSSRGWSWRPSRSAKMGT